MYIPAAFGGGNVQVFMLNYCLGINTEVKILFINLNNFCLEYILITHCTLC